VGEGGCIASGIIYVNDLNTRHVKSDPTTESSHAAETINAHF